MIRRNTDSFVISVFKLGNPGQPFYYSETLNFKFIERVYQMSYSSLSDNGMLQIFSFWIKWLYGAL